MLELHRAARHFGGVRAVDGLDLKVNEREIVGLIGPNGSGKSTAVNVITGLFPLTSGEILFKGRTLDGLPTHKRLELGIARTFQNIRLFGQLSVWQKLWVAQNSPQDRARRGFFARWLGGQKGVRDEIGELLEFSASPRGRTSSPPTCRSASSAGLSSRAPSRQGRAPPARRAAAA